MSRINAYQSPISDYSRQQYTKYLQDQLEKLSSFMLYQKKQNQKHNQLINVIEDQNQKIKLLNDKVLLIDLYQNQNLKNQQKLFNSVQQAISLQKRVHKLESFYPYERNQEKNSQRIDSGIKKQILKQIDCRVNQMYSEIHQQMIQLQKDLMKNFQIILKDNQTNQRIQLKQKVSKMKISKDDMSPLQTNYSENDRSHVREFHKNEDFNKKEVKKIERRISSFVNQRLQKLENQLTSRYEGMNHSVQSSMHTSEIYNQQQRSPISAYLKKQNQYKSSLQNIELNNKHHNLKPFYSACQRKPTKTPKSKSGRSKSRSKSNRSVSKSNKQKLKNKKQILEFKLNKDSSKVIQSNKNKDVTTQRIGKKHQSLYLKEKSHVNKNAKNHDKKSSKTKIHKKQKSKISSNSHLSLSQASSHSRSRSKSNSKQLKNQKQYLMYCNKFH